MIDPLTGTSCEARSERALSLWLTRLLFYGLILAMLLIVLGSVLSLISTGALGTDLLSLEALPAGLGALDPTAVITLGIVVLIATPILREITLVIGYARCRLWLFSGIGLAVLVVLATRVF